MPLAANEIQFKELDVPPKLLEELDRILRDGWTMKEVEVGREVKLRTIIEKYVYGAERTAEIMTEIKYAYGRQGWEVTTQMEKLAHFKPKGHR